MRAGRLLTKHAEEESEVPLVSCEREIPPIPCAEQAISVSPDCNHHMLFISRLGVELPPVDGTVEDLKIHQPIEHRTKYQVQPSEFCCLPLGNTRVLESEFVDELSDFQPPDISKAIKSVEPKTSLEMLRPEAIQLRSNYTLIKKALLPKIKYHWDSGFKQGPQGGWVKCPVIKLKIKYGEEDQELLPPILSVEGGGEAETKQVKLDAGRAKCKLRANQLKPVQLRVVPLDKRGRQEAWVPEFLFTVEKITGDEIGAEKWWRGVVTPALPE